MYCIIGNSLIFFKTYLLNTKLEPELKVNSKILCCKVELSIYEVSNCEPLTSGNISLDET